MKKLFAFIAVFGWLTFGAFNQLSAATQQEAEFNPEDAQEEVDPTIEQSNEELDSPADADTDIAGEETAEEGKGIHQQIKEKFIEGGASFMSLVLLALILGLAVAIERIFYLNLASVNSKKLLTRVEEALSTGGVDAALDICRSTRGPIASIFYQGLERSKDNDIETVEKSVINYGGVQMGLLEKNLSWLSLFISVAPMLGFLGTVIGMIVAFDQIEVAGDVNASDVAGGIKIALITTVSGLIVAIFLQVFYNYIVSKIDAIVNEMEDASISLVDMIAKYKAKG